MATNFQWFVQGGAEMPPLNFPLVEEWVRRVAAARDRILGPVSYIFCDDERILQVNREFLRHDYYTDIITFDDCRGRLLRGDLFISLDTVESNAVLQGATYREELMRVIIHGILHLCGINDKGPGEREIMEAAENQSIKMLHELCDERRELPFAAAHGDAAPSEERYMDRSVKCADHEVWRTAREADKELWRTARDAAREVDDSERHFG